MNKIASIEEHAKQKAGLQMRRNISNPDAKQPGDTQLYELSGILQSTLKLDTLLEFFDDELSSTVPHDGLIYEFPDEGISYKFGEPGKHKCHYNFILLDQFLGQLVVSRNKKFSEDELKRIELLTTALLYPIRNSLMYLRALKTAYCDPLTELNNRAALEKDLEQEIDFAHRHGISLSIIILDLDNFKNINDTYGHIAGDDVLKKLAHCMTDCIRRSDIIYRYGGEEFIVLLRHTGTVGAKLLAERMRRAIEKLVYKHNNFEIQITASFGVATLCTDETKNAFLQRADAALYQAKEEGRNRTIVAPGKE